MTKLVATQNAPNAERVECPLCPRTFVDASALFQHGRSRHRQATAGNNALITKPRTKRQAEREDESLADCFVEAQANRGAGVPNEPWIEDMLP